MSGIKTFNVAPEFRHELAPFEHCSGFEFSCTTNKDSRSVFSLNLKIDGVENVDIDEF